MDSRSQELTLLIPQAKQEAMTLEGVRSQESAVKASRIAILDVYVVLLRTVVNLS